MLRSTGLLHMISAGSVVCGAVHLVQVSFSAFNTLISRYRRSGRVPRRRGLGLQRHIQFSALIHILAQALVFLLLCRVQVFRWCDWMQITCAFPILAHLLAAHATLNTADTL